MTWGDLVVAEGESQMGKQRKRSNLRHDGTAPRKGAVSSHLGPLWGSSARRCLVVTTETWPAVGSKSSAQALPLPGPGVFSLGTWEARLSRSRSAAAHPSYPPSRCSAAAGTENETRALFDSYLPAPQLQKKRIHRGDESDTERKPKLCAHIVSTRLASPFTAAAVLSVAEARGACTFTSCFLNV